MPTLIESLTSVPSIDIGQLANELVSNDRPNAVELGSDGRILVKLPEDQEFPVDLVLFFRLAS